MNISIQNLLQQINQLESKGLKSKGYQNQDLNKIDALSRGIIFGNSQFVNDDFSFLFIIMPLYTKTVNIAISNMAYYLKQRIRYVPKQVIQIRGMYDHFDQIIDTKGLTIFKSTLKTCIVILDYYINFGSKQMTGIPQFQSLTLPQALLNFNPLFGIFTAIDHATYQHAFGQTTESGSYAYVNSYNFLIGLNIVNQNFWFRLSFTKLQLVYTYQISSVFDGSFYFGLNGNQFLSLINDYKLISSQNFFNGYNSSRIILIQEKSHEMAQQFRRKLDQKADNQYIKNIQSSAGRLDQRQQQIVEQMQKMKNQIEQRRLLIQSLIKNVQELRKTSKTNHDSGIQALTKQIDENRNIIKQLQINVKTTQTQIRDIKTHVSRVEEKTTILDAKSRQQAKKQDTFDIQLKKKLEGSVFTDFQKQYRYAKKESQQNIKVANKQINRINAQFALLNNNYTSRMQAFQQRVQMAAGGFQRMGQATIEKVKSQSKSKIKSMQYDVNRYKTTIDAEISNLTKIISQSVVKSQTILSQFKEATSESIQERFETQRQQHEKIMSGYKKDIYEQTLKQVSRINQKVQKKTNDLNKNKVSFQAFMGFNHIIYNKGLAIDKKLNELDNDKVSLDKYNHLGDKLIQQKQKMKQYILDQTKLEKQQSIKRTEDRIKEVNDSLRSSIKLKVNKIQMTMKKLRDTIAKISAQQRLLSQRLQQLKVYFDEQYKRLNTKVDNKDKKVNKRVDEVKQQNEVLQRLSKSRYQKSIRFTMQQAQKLKKRIQVNQIKAESDFIDRQYRQNPIFRYQTLTNSALGDRYRYAKYQMQEQVKNILKQYQQSDVP